MGTGFVMGLSVVWEVEFTVGDGIHGVEGYSRVRIRDCSRVFWL